MGAALPKVQTVDPEGDTMGAVEVRALRMGRRG